MPGVLGDLPGVLRLYRTKQTTYIILRASTWLYAAEPARNTSEQLAERSRPLIDLDRDAIHEPYNRRQGPA